MTKVVRRKWLHGLGADTLPANYASARDVLIKQLGTLYNYDPATQTGTLPNGGAFRGPETAYIDMAAQWNYSRALSLLAPPDSSAIEKVSAPPLYFGPPSPGDKAYIDPREAAGTLPGAGGAGDSRPPASEIPVWVWILGIGAALYFLSDGRH